MVFGRFDGEGQAVPRVDDGRQRVHVSPVLVGEVRTDDLHVEVEGHFLPPSALSGEHGGDVAAGGDVGQGDGGRGGPVLPYVAPPSALGVDFQGHFAAVEDVGGVCSHPFAVYGDIGFYLGLLAVAVHGDGKHLFALHAVFVGIGGSPYTAVVGHDGNVLGRLSVVPFPVARICDSGRQLRLKGDHSSGGQRFGGLHHVSVPQSSQFGLFHGDAVVLHERGERGRHQVGRCDGVSGVQQDGIPQVVVAAAGGASPATVNAHLLVGPLGEWHCHAFHAFIVSDDGSPIGAYMGA